MSDGLDLVRQLGTAPPLDDATDDRIRRKLVGLIEASGEAAPAGLLPEGDELVVLDLADRRREREARQPGRWGLRAALVAAAAAIVVVAALGPLRSGAPAPTVADLADAARTGPHTTIVEGQVLRTVEQSTTGSSDYRLVRRIRPDGSGTEVTEDLASGQSGTNVYDPGSIPLAGLPYSLVVTLPATPAGLEGAITGFSQSDDERPLIRSLVEVTSSTATAPAVRATAFEQLRQRGARIEEVDGTDVLVVEAADGWRLVATIDLDRGVITSLDVFEPGADEAGQHTQYMETTVEVE